MAVFEFACVINGRCIQLYVYLIATLVHVVFICVVRAYFGCVFSVKMIFVRAKL